MCNQSVGLIQRQIEYAGITTVSISLLREITEKTRPPRALFVPFPLGYPLGEPNNTDLQTRIMRAAFALLSRNDCPVLETFMP
jgi:D-proline reductase (dithiol) PrdB